MSTTDQPGNAFTMDSGNKEEVSSLSSAFDGKVEQEKQNPSVAELPRPQPTCMKRTIDETLLPEEEAKKLQMRRAYNRECASRARKRTKTHIADLQAQVCALQRERGELRKAVVVTKHQLEMVEKQYRSERLKNALMTQQQSTTMVDLPLLSRSGFSSGIFPNQHTL